MRRPDVTVDRGTPESSLERQTPTVAFEVLSPSTRQTDLMVKIEEYKAVASLRHVALVDPDRPVVLLYTRGGGDGVWTAREIEGLDAQLPLDAIGVDLPLAEIYEGLSFEEASS